MSDENLARLGIEFDPSGALTARDEVVKSFEDIAKAAENAAKTISGTLGGKVDTSGPVKSMEDIKSAAKSGADQTAGYWSKAFEIIKTGAGALGIGLGVLKLTEFITSSISAAAEYERLGVVMHEVGETAGYTASQMDAVQASIQKDGLSMNEARDSLVRLTRAHIDLADATILSGLAENLSATSSMTEGEAMDSLIRSVQMGNQRLLIMLGLHADFIGAQNQMKLALGGTTVVLTEQQREQANLNAVQQAARSITDAHAAAMTTAAGVMKDSASRLDDLKVALGGAFTTIHTAAVTVYAGALGTVATFLMNNGPLLAGMAAAITAFGAMTVAIYLVNAALGKGGEALIAWGVKLLASPLAPFLLVAMAIGAAFGVIAHNTAVARDELDKFSKTLGSYTDKDLTAALDAAEQKMKALEEQRAQMPTYGALDVSKSGAQQALEDQIVQEGVLVQLLQRELGVRTQIASKVEEQAIGMNKTTIAGMQVQLAGASGQTAVQAVAANLNNQIAEATKQRDALAAMPGGDATVLTSQIRTMTELRDSIVGVTEARHHEAADALTASTQELGYAQEELKNQLAVNDAYANGAQDVTRLVKQQQDALTIEKARADAQKTYIANLGNPELRGEAATILAQTNAKIDATAATMKLKDAEAGLQAIAKESVAVKDAQDLVAASQLGSLALAEETKAVERRNEVLKESAVMDATQLATYMAKWDATQKANDQLAYEKDLMTEVNTLAKDTVLADAAKKGEVAFAAAAQQLDVMKYFMDNAAKYGLVLAGVLTLIYAAQKKLEDQAAMSKISAGLQQDSTDLNAQLDALGKGLDAWKKVVDQQKDEATVRAWLVAHPLASDDDIAKARAILDANTKLTEQVDKQKTLLEAQKSLQNDASKRWKAMADDVQKGFQDAFTKIIDGSVKSWGDFTDILRKMFQKLISDIAAMKVTGPLMDLLLGKQTAVPGADGSAVTQRLGGLFGASATAGAYPETSGLPAGIGALSPSGGSSVAGVLGALAPVLAVIGVDFSIMAQQTAAANASIRAFNAAIVSIGTFITGELVPGLSQTVTQIQTAFADQMKSYMTATLDALSKNFPNGSLFKSPSAAAHGQFDLGNLQPSDLPSIIAQLTAAQGQGGNVKQDQVLKQALADMTALNAAYQQAVKNANALFDSQSQSIARSLGSRMLTATGGPGSADAAGQAALLDKNVNELAAAIAAFNAGTGGWTKDLLKQLGDVQNAEAVAFAAAQKLAHDRALQDAQTRTFAASGGAGGGPASAKALSDLQFQIAQERELADVRKSGVSQDIVDATIEAQAAEKKLRDQEWADQQKAAQQDYQVRLLSATGHKDEAAALQLQLTQQREYDAAVKAGMDDATLAALALAQAAETAQANALAAANAIKAMGDLQVRLLNANGQTGAGADLAFQLQQQLEMAGALAQYGKDSDYVKLLAQVQAAEKVAYDAAKVTANSATTASSSASAASAMAASTTTAVTTVAATLTDRTALMLVDIEKQELEILGKIYQQGSGMNGGGGGGGGGGATTMDVAVNVRVGASPTEEATQIATAIKRELDRLFGNDTTRYSLSNGNVKRN